MKNKIMTVVFIVVLSVICSFLGSYLYSSLVGGKDLPREEKVLNNLKDSLSLSENQICKMQECQNCFKDKLSAISCRIHQERIELIKLLRDGNQDTSRIHTIMNKIDSLQSSLLHNIVDNILDQKNILDNSQKEKFFEMLISQISDDKKSCINKHNH
jgi:hypothetical protein